MAVGERQLAGVLGTVFRVTKSASQTFSNPATLMTWTSEAYDTHGWFASDRYTPLSEGYYMFWLETIAHTTGGGSAVPLYYIKLNGSISSTTTVALGLIPLFTYMNGVSDYIEAWGQSTVTSTDLTSARMYGYKVF